MEAYKVYVMTDERGYITAVNSSAFVSGEGRREIDEGLGDRILICNDVCLKTMWRSYGGPGYAHILRTVKQMALENGISESVYESLLTDNVRSFLT